MIKKKKRKKREKDKKLCLFKRRNSKARFSPNYSVILVILFATICLITLFNTNTLGSRKKGFLRGLVAAAVI